MLLAIAAVAVPAFLAYRYLNFRSGVKDNKYPLVQRAIKQAKQEERSPFLPGSRVGSNAGKKVEIKRPELAHLGKKRKKKNPFRNKEDLKRSILMDLLLRRKDL